MKLVTLILIVEVILVYSVPKLVVNAKIQTHIGEMIKLDAVYYHFVRKTNIIVIF
jgi:hypothetical protein